MALIPSRSETQDSSWFNTSLTNTSFSGCIKDKGKVALKITFLFKRSDVIR